MFLKKILNKIIFYLGVFLFILFGLFGLAALALQSNLGRERVAAFVSTALQGSGWSFSAETTEGILTEKVVLHKVVLTSPQGDTFTAETIHLKLSLLRLLNREIAFQHFHADDVVWTSKRRVASRSASKGLSYAIRSNDVVLTNIHLPNDILASLKGSLYLGRKLRTVSANLDLIREDIPDANAHLVLNIHPNRETVLNLHLRTPTFDLLAPWASLPVVGSGSFSLLLKGPLDAYTALFLKKNPSQQIYGIVRGSCSIQEILKPSELNILLNRSWSLASSIAITPEQELIFSKVNIKNDALGLEGSFALNFSGELLRSSLMAHLNNLSALDLTPLEGKLTAELESTQTQASLNLSSERLLYRDLIAKDALASFHLQKEGQTWHGLSDLSMNIKDQEWVGKGNLTWTRGGSLKIQDLMIEAHALNLEGDLEFYSPTRFKGALSLKVPHIQELNAFYSPWPFYGSATANAIWTLPEDASPILMIDGFGTNLFYRELEIQDAHLAATVLDPFGESDSTAHLELKAVRYGQFFTETFDAHLTEEVNTKKFSLNAQGDWLGPFTLTADGTLEKRPAYLLFTLQDLTGNLFSTPIALASPAQMEFGPNLLNLPLLECSFGNASLLATLVHKGDDTKAKILLDRLPINFLSVNPLDFSVSGTLQLNAEIEQKGEETQGDLHAFLVNAQVTPFGETISLQGGGLLNAKLKNNRWDFDVNLTMNNQPLLTLKSDLPLNLSLYPFHFEIPLYKQAEAKFAYQGKVEELLDYFDFGANRLEGNCACSFSLSGILAAPMLEGSLHFQNGYYENYFTGTRLTHIQAEVEAEGSSLTLRSLTAEDMHKKGKISLQGIWHADYVKRFPFEFNGTFLRLDLTDINWVKTEAGGTIHIVGNRDQARVSGDAVILESDMSIPDRLPHNLPNLQVKYINAPKPIAVETNKQTQPFYPIFFDYRVHAPDGVFVTGRGLSSEWKGDFQIGGTYTDLEAKGKLDLINGQFGFSGKFFKLTEGSLVFSGKPHELPLLNIAATLDLPTVVVIARLNGHLNAPQLSFQSIPALPMGSILSHLLFGQDIADINAIQAAQLVNSISTISGQGPNIMENTKNSLKVDRLRIVATPLNDEGGGTYALQVGKYVTRGVLVSVSQGFDLSGDYLSNPNLSIEIDLANGFVFEAEAQGEQEQGKFTLKWNLNY